MTLTVARDAHASEGATREQELETAVAVRTLNPCLEQAPLVDEIEEFLERSTVDAGLRVDVGESNGTLFFVLSPPGGRHFSHTFPDLPPDCEGQRRAVALSIALAIDALSPASEAGAAARAARPFTLAADLGASSGLPSAFGFAGGVSLSRRLGRRLRVRLGALAIDAPAQSVADLSLRFDTWLVVARTEGCGVLPLGARTELLGCLGPWLGTMSTRSSGIPGAGTESRFFAAAAAALELHVHLSPVVAIHLGVDGLVALRRSKVRVESAEGETAFEQEFPRGTGVLRFGPSFSF